MKKLNSLLLSPKEDFEILGRYHEVFLEFLPIPIFLLNNCGQIVLMNKKFEQLSGYYSSELLNKNLNYLFVEENKCDQLLLAALTDNQNAQKKLKLKNRNGKTISTVCCAIAEKNFAGQPIGFFLYINPTNKDLVNYQLSDQKAEEMKNIKEILTNMLEDGEKDRKKIQAEEIKTRTILLSLNDGLIVLNKNDQVVLLNPNAEIILRIKEKDVLNKNINQIQNCPRLKRLLKKLKEFKNDKNKEFVTQYPQTRYYQIISNNAIIKNEKVNKIITIHDITREKEIDRIKSEFISIAAHQLRTPLSAIKWSISIAMDSKEVQSNQETKEILLKGYLSNERVINLINDMLNVSRIEEGRFNYKYNKCHCSEVIDVVLNNLENQIKEKSLEIVFKKPKKVPALNIDKEKMIIALQNLLDNAVKYTPYNGKIEITLSVAKDFIKLKILDNGVGIPKDDQKKIFTKFFRGANVMRMQTDGSGLGLFITRNIIRGHGGKLNFTSREGRGTEFILIIPIK
ncbi:hypothetical protein A2331_03355 [Candidatus Falkowbacteria bacterium RIFOXYB2_FULL_34_18]|uniref:histidine kinase n=1 Tax=Candidatus Falkowbacteria bacterium RIFOXYD2_FULL_34_120 TaxID=1798007 RepID=A0A1F5TNG7_9BACT|nr:MAG: hypothetical protein A2331_03355 [Candidatus Falkowbacteria bacterium RIFOXYB2_FULL_34_18]OGF28942.1 MAG: hypothetical protein A2500_01705 [Candidatus Falkowbacteria bacterium RIFOXYC12_FULL_34_55]OGF35859.1 MAG: hypothetical protein A2466_03675 [Candidatus Falkowbacteria bacterium RIFOXYC2_FULL_34_220]OGF38466.1 MAG: hypothetical protein A2515_07045 [Candidatus Falkowbacteria bacterium RIFOXYD12_FULL_34_57]OGF40532.1 MAG: hypothetical protein A2531_04460 [Candidatus Falkowbacteria bact